MDNIIQYDKILSLGPQCYSQMIINNIFKNSKKYGEATPFSWTQNQTIMMIYYHIKDEFRLMKNELDNFNLTGLTEYSFDVESENINNEINNYINNQKKFPGKKLPAPYLYKMRTTSFSHYLNGSFGKSRNINSFKASFTRKINRFLYYLNEDYEILFVHFNKDYILLKQYRENSDILYEYLQKLDILLTKKYPKLKYKIFNINSDKLRMNEGNIINRYIKIPDDLLLVRDTPSEYIEILPNIEKVVKMYSDCAERSLKKYLSI